MTEIRSQGRRYPWFKLRFHDGQVAKEFTRGFQIAFRASRNGNEEGAATSDTSSLTSFDRGVVFFAKVWLLCRKDESMSPAGAVYGLSPRDEHTVCIYMYEMVYRNRSVVVRNSEGDSSDDTSECIRVKVEDAKRKRATDARAFRRNVRGIVKDSGGKLIPKGKSKYINSPVSSRRK